MYKTDEVDQISAGENCVTVADAFSQHIPNVIVDEVIPVNGIVNEEIYIHQANIE